MSADFVDTNVIGYSLSDGATKRRQALLILANQPVLSLQVLNEAANVMRRKLGFEIPVIREVLLRWLRESRLHPLASSTLLSALEVAARYGFSHYDRLMIAAALQKNLHDAGIPTAVHYPVPLNEQAAYQHLFCPDCTPFAQQIVKQVMRACPCILIWISKPLNGSYRQLLRLRHHKCRQRQ